jgi:hypothetical protein
MSRGTLGFLGGKDFRVTKREVQNPLRGYTLFAQQVMDDLLNRCRLADPARAGNRHALRQFP